MDLVTLALAKKELKKYKSNLANELGSDTAEGTGLTLDKTAEFDLDLTLKGNTIQTQYEGYNILPIPDIVETTNNGITYSANNGEIKLNGTATSNVAIYLTDNLELTTTEKITVIRNSNKLEDITPAIYITIDDTEYNSQNQTTHRDYRTFSAGTISKIRVYVKSGEKLSNVSIKPMLYLGEYDETKVYEPYVGGQASPNPEYPQNVHVLKDSNTIKIYNENMFDGVMEQGQINTGTGLNTNSKTVIRTKNFFKIPEAVTTLKIIRTVATGAWVTREYDENKNYLGFQIKCTANVYSNQFTLLEGTRYIRFVDLSNDLNGKFCLTSNLTQEEYIEPKQQVKTLTLPNGMEMCKIGDYKDEFVKDLNTNKWYKNKKIIKTVLNGSESWKLSSAWSKTNTNVYYVTTINDALYESQDATYYLTNLFIAFSRNNLVNSDVNGFAYSGNVNTNNPAFTCRIEKTLASSVDDFKTLLASNNLIVYYILATPVEEEITDTTLINQLNDIKEAYTYQRQTNITQENADLPFIIEANYKLSNLSRIEALEQAIN